MLYCPTIWLAKSALLFQLMRIFAPARRGSIYWTIHVLVWANLMFYVSAFITILFQCIPQDKIWNPEREGGHCINYYVATIATGSVNVVSDILILLLPMFVIWRLRMGSNQKLGVSAVFATGLL